MILTYKNGELTIYNLTCIIDKTFDNYFNIAGYKKPYYPFYPLNLIFREYFFDKNTDHIEDANYKENGYDHILSLKILYHENPVIDKNQFIVEENMLKYCDENLFFMALLKDKINAQSNNFRNIDFKSYINTSVTEKNYKEHNRRCIKYILKNDLVKLISKLQGISKINKLLVCINHGKKEKKPIGKLPFELAGYLLTFIDILEPKSSYKEDRFFDFIKYLKKAGNYLC